ncbi:putative carboxylesterase, 2-hydroxyisoflavanone dehydratase [Lupinus albus]|uniref:Putative carboxylesterase, 2-hydroxyisoflavanone dehydratase n=1 Tax=Lupinus albus TaxID=3870 RepID=A0A6A4NIM1_LUPAL|nr:putative carboxylesterase, 2-hydroxyisoflavanone dehydratase [Lupinus albus]
MGSSPRTVYVPPILDDSHPILNSKDITISHNPLVTARIYLPKLIISNDQNQLQKLPILVYFHGGGFIFESAFSQVFDNYFNNLIPLANVIVVSVEYRRAPEYQLPACYHNAWYALKWVSSHSTANNNTNYFEPWLINYGDFNRVFIGGDSAGVGSEPVLHHNNDLAFIVWDLIYPSAPGGIDNPVANPINETFSVFST